MTGAAPKRSTPSRPRRGRPPKRAPEAQRQHILAAAAARFARQGFDGASLRDIAADAGVAHAVIRQAFGSKSDLWEAAAEDLFTQLNEAIARALAAVDLNDAQARIDAQVRATVGAAARIPWLAAFVMQAGLAGGARYDALVERHLRPAHAFTLAPFLQLQEQRLVEDFDPHFLFMLATNAAIGPFAQGANARALAGMDLADPNIAERYADVLIAVLKHGVLRQQPGATQRKNPHTSRTTSVSSAPHRRAKESKP